MDNEYNIIARPFIKFFNLSEHENPKLPKVPQNKEFSVYDKVDGSLGIVFLYNNELIFATRGSFTSDQSIMAKKIFNAKYNKETIIEGFTYLFEIIYPENKIVINYGNKKELILLAVIKTNSGFELDYKSLTSVSKEIGCDIVQQYNFNSLEEIKLYIKDNDTHSKEGFVIKWNNGFRVKIKYNEYCMLHKIITGTNEITVWENLMNGTLEALLELIPDEMYDWVEEIKKDLEYRFNKIYNEAKNNANEISAMNLKTRKDLAEIVKERNNPGLIFSLIDGHDITNRIWKQIKPKIIQDKLELSFNREQT